MKLGSIELNRIGLGTNRINDNDESRSILMHTVEHGINFIDTAHVYTGGTSERVIGETLAPFRENLVVATKGGMGAEGNGATPEILRQQLDQSLKSLQTDCITLYQLHRVDPNVEIEVSVGAMREFQQAGKVEHIGLSEVTVEQIKRAQAVAPIASVQNHYNLTERKHEEVVDYCTEQGIIFIPYFPLGGRSGGDQAGERLAGLTEKYGVSAHELALAWLLKRSPMMLPIPGTLSPEHLDANVHAATIELRDDYESLSE